MKPVELRGHDRQITVCKYNYDGDLCFSGGADKRVTLYDAFTYEKLGEYRTWASVKSLEIDIDSKYLFVGNYNGMLELFEVQTGKLLGRLERDWKIKFVEIPVGNKELIVVYEDMIEKVSDIAIFDLKSIINEITQSGTKTNLKFQDAKIIKEFSLPEQVSRMSYGYLNKYFIGTTQNGKIQKLNLDGKVEIEEQAHPTECKGFSFAVDYSLVATCGSDGVSVYDPQTLKQIKKFKTQVPMNTVTISPLVADRQNPRFHLLMAGGIPAREAAMSKKGGFEIHLCNIMYEKELGTISGSFSPINSIVFSPDGRGFMCGAEEGVSKIIKFDQKYFDQFK